VPLAPLVIVLTVVRQARRRLRPRRPKPRRLPFGTDWPVQPGAGRKQAGKTDYSKLTDTH
ncbi:hypothetical protein ABTN34_18315, partial [Acinetobacter baumannii]